LAGSHLILYITSSNKWWIEGWKDEGLERWKVGKMEGLENPQTTHANRMCMYMRLASPFNKLEAVGGFPEKVVSQTYRNLIKQARYSSY